ncbi:MAG: hypothetical protein LBM01_02615 [Christensenellaceae bacterium]|jgi:hypothetical protein|nr:hypothetical protein [Christensenellaceae bacterium]
MNYFRITAHYPTENTTIIIDSNGKFEHLWQFSSALMAKGFNIIEVSKGENLSNPEIRKAEISDKYILRKVSKN